MPRARLILDAAFTLAPVPHRLFGSFVEHMGRCVYTGIYEPDHATADEHGFRADVAELTRQIGPTVVRYPGGNFVSGYRWEDGIGPVAERPSRLDLAWRSTEPNSVGIHEFDSWARSVDTEVMMAVNLGTRGLQEACDLLEYTNHPSGSYWSDRRIANGAKDPFGYRLWCLGNEMDGPWQIGHKTAYEYGRLAAETGRAMRLIDSSIELVACGSSNAQMPTFGAWESEVLTQCYDEVDYVSLHVYYGEHDGDTDSYLASAVDMDHFIESVIATADAVRARGRHQKRINLSFDEWNVIHPRERGGDDLAEQAPWTFHPRLGESTYHATDAVVVGTMLNSLLRHGDRVTVGCQAQLVNVLGLIRSEPGGEAWKQSIAYPFEQLRRLARGEILQVISDSDLHPTARFGDVPVVDASATFDAESQTAAVFVANRSRTEAVRLEIDCRGLGVDHLAGATVQDPSVQDGLTPRPFTAAGFDQQTLCADLPPLSWTVFELDRVSAQLIETPSSQGEA